MKKLVATGEILKSEQLLITGSVYTEYDAAGVEQDAAGNHIVTLYVKQFAVDMPDEAVTFADISALGALKVPGFDGHADVTVDNPTKVLYVKSKAYEVEEDANVNTVIRYVY